MAKRKNRDKKPNIPQETLDRARQQVGGGQPTPQPEVDDEMMDAAPDTYEDELIVDEAPQEPVRTRRFADSTATAVTGATRAERRAGRSRRSSRSTSSASTASSAVRARTRKSKTFDEMTHEEIEELLQHPTKEVSEEELHQQYGYVLADLRNMGVLAAVLFVVLVLVAQFL